MGEISIYIHIPFCKSKCLYCDFLSYGGREAYIEPYINALIDEIRSFKCEKNVKSIYIGGGTPSIIDQKYIQNIMGELYACFKIKDDAEITIEANPGTVDFEKLSVYRKAGINRISFGLQSCNNDLLKKIGRIHTFEEFEHSFKSARKAGFENINCDIMFSLPGQTPEDYFDTIKGVTDLKPEHISAYSLIIEEGTPFYDMYNNGQFKMPDEDADRYMYHRGTDLLEEKGYFRYEISNYAKSGRQCQHNIVYWRRDEYKGFGLGAASLVDEVRLKNTESLSDYIQGNYVCEKEQLTLIDEQEEFMFLGLRCIEGVSEKDFLKCFGVTIDSVYGKQIEEMVKQGLMERCDGRIFLTEKGLDLANMVFVEFMQ